jgi:hypothetical protein
LICDNCAQTTTPAVFLDARQIHEIIALYNAKRESRVICETLSRFTQRGRESRTRKKVLQESLARKSCEKILRENPARKSCEGNPAQTSRG